jgi:hypothetical protein
MQAVRLGLLESLPRTFFILVTYLVLRHCIPSLLGDPPVLNVIEQAMLSQCTLEIQTRGKCCWPFTRFLECRKETL